MATNTLTDSKCRGFKPRDKGYKKFDGEGLNLWITPLGSKLWRQSFRWEGKEQTISWGPYPQVSLAEARAKRDQAKRQLRDSINPMAATAAPKPAALTFSKCAELYWAGRKDCTPKYIDNATRALDTYLVPALGQRPIDSIKLRALYVEPLLDASDKQFRKGIPLRFKLTLQEQGRRAMNDLLNESRPKARRNLYWQLRQINDALGIPTDSMEVLGVEQPAAAGIEA